MHNESFGLEQGDRNFFSRFHHQEFAKYFQGWKYIILEEEYHWFWCSMLKTVKMTSFYIRGVKENKGEIYCLDQLNKKCDNFGLNLSNCNPLFSPGWLVHGATTERQNLSKNNKACLGINELSQSVYAKSEVPGFEYLQFFCTLRCPLFFWQNLQQYIQTTHRNQKIRGTRSCTARNRPNMRLVLKMGQNDFNSVLRPPIKILSTLFTLQLLILPTRDPFYGQKSKN